MSKELNVLLLVLIVAITGWLVWWTWVADWVGWPLVIIVVGAFLAYWRWRRLRQGRPGDESWHFSTSSSDIGEPSRTPRHVRFHIPEQALDEMAFHEDYFNSNLVELLRSAREEKSLARLPHAEFEMVRESLVAASKRMSQDTRMLFRKISGSPEKGASKEYLAVQAELMQKIGDIIDLRRQTLFVLEMMDLSAADFNRWE